MSDPATGARRHWLYRPETLPKLWTWGCGMLAVTVAAEIFVDLHPHFGFASWFGFNAIYGFVSCLVMVVGAKWLGGFVKRSDDYYEAGTGTGDEARAIGEGADASGGEGGAP